jgi:hypothetical protein
MSKAPRELAICVDYVDVLLAFRARAEELGLSRLTIDYLGGLPHGQAGRILSPFEGRRMGAVSLSKMCRALAVKIVIVDDPVQRARNAEQAEPRSEHCVRHRECNGSAA